MQLKLKYLIAVFIVTISMVRAQTPNLFQINGTLTGMPDAELVLLSYSNLGKKMTDTARISEGTYSFMGSIYAPQVFTISVKYKPSAKQGVMPSDKAELYLTDGIINISSANTFNNMELSGEGTIWNKDYWALTRQIKLNGDSIGNLMYKFRMPSQRVANYEKAVAAGEQPPYSHANYVRDSTTLSFINDEVPALKQRLIHHVMIPYIRKNPNSPVTHTALGVVASSMEYNLTQSAFDLLSPEIKNSYPLQQFAKMLERTAKTGEGIVAPDITLPNEQGKLVSLSSLQGKYVLVDFWASWCSPCRGTIPMLKEIYEKYKDKGFEILSVSIDKNGQQWKTALEEEKMPWYQVLDEKHEIGKLYQVSSIPRCYLIDKDGTIISRNVEVFRLEKMLEKLIEKK
ncbi:TlpA disulfide reductase family protein [Sphingobacterium lumbrici]|uniref:TlpA disulfide reductase family protein n=1 Tax=Sphingobacterium lumbrici TaxID=2559600 RepID=UPI0011285993|nr:TlpA disulfide reductase family protein [Sphingobacterium lumbrici]